MMRFGSSGNHTPKIIITPQVGFCVSLIGDWFKLAGVNFAIKVLDSCLCDSVQPTIDAFNHSISIELSETIPSVIPTRVDTNLISIARDCSRCEVPVLAQSFQDTLVSGASPFSRLSNHIAGWVTSAHRYTDILTDTL